MCYLYIIIIENVGKIAENLEYNIEILVFYVLLLFLHFREIFDKQPISGYTNWARFIGTNMIII